ncbi:MAG: universal stress protein [Planctomycetes bacterium]|nr:universal stress protein [Planctomycetota bacterium]
MEIRRIVFATDLSELSFQAWPAALEFARKWNAPLHAVCVIEEPYALAPYEQYGALLRALQEMRPEIEQRLRDRVRDRPPEVVVETAVLESASPAKALVDYAKNLGADLIVTTTHGRGGLSHLLLGSVTERLLRTAPMPVLVVRVHDGAKLE